MNRSCSRFPQTSSRFPDLRSLKHLGSWRSNNPSICSRFEDAHQVLDEMLQTNSLLFHMILYKISGYLV
ncbi:hypothetical protein HanXRQr2_Chr04g0153731 [Helianthus annuus]|uniref:Uncharacterized protein n=1 Tax=Helianthus annuus TaxID=4232 RepID=A0A9K3J766_HELAN|nr:hypothetical protein HanXRQr2_Chr04g0153731 [Helianthus annuus]KAJ0930330.1 hypothetical protein HanPSC8_Chr04g0148031 [Helianthus annuus]